MKTGGRIWTVTYAAALAAQVMCASPAAGQSPLTRVAGLTVRGEGLDVALRLLQRTAGVSLVYSPDLLPSERIVDCVCSDATVEEALATILYGTGLTYTASRTLIRVVPRGEDREAGRTGVIEGRIVDAEWDTPVVNAMVWLASGRGSLSDARGLFVLRDLPVGFHRLEVTSIGWRPEVVEVDVRGADTLSVTIRLKREPIPLPAIVVAPGTFGMLEDVSPTTVSTLTRAELATMPQVGEDVFRSVRRLPGVTSDDISTRLNVRGGYDQEVMVRLDGLELYEPYHLKDWNGVLGIVDVHSLGGVQLTSGGFGAEYGDKTAGILDMTSRTSLGGNKTTLGVSISNVTAMSRGDFGGERGGWLLSARRGFLDLVLDLVDENPAFSPQYYDVFGKLAYQLTPTNLLTAHVLHAGDSFIYRDKPPEGIDEADISSTWASSYGWLTWKATPGRRFTSTTIGSTGQISRNRSGFVLDLADAPDLIDTDDHRSFRFAGIRNDASYEISDDVLLKLGGEAKWVGADYDFGNFRRWSNLAPDSTIVKAYDSVKVAMEPRGHEVSAYVAARTRPAERLIAEVGVRYDRISHTRDSDFSPRLLAAVELSPTTTVRASWGRYRQSHGIQELEVGDGETEYFPSERADQLALGLEHRFRNGVDARLELYERRMADQRPVFFNAEQELQIFAEAAFDRMIFQPDRGRARGVELLAERRSGSRLAWSASYALAVAEDRVGGSWVPRRFDQRHTIGVHLAYTPALHWNVSLGWRFHSGWPATPWSYGVTTLPDGSDTFHQVFGALRTDRVPAYHRLDMRVTRDFLIGGNVMTAFIDLLNVYDRANLGSYSYERDYQGGRMTIARHDGQTGLPLLPTFGLRYEF